MSEISMRYTRQQILEKLEFWRRELEKLDEDKTNNGDERIVVNDENFLIIDHGNGLRTVNMY